METVNLKLVLTGTGWEDHWPRCRVSVNDTEFYNNEIIGEQTVEFDLDLQDDSENVLKVEYYNLDFRKDIVLNDSGEQIKSKYVIINKLFVDDIDCGNIPYDLSEVYVNDGWYTKQDPQDFPNPRKNDSQLSWNSTWCLKFNSPVYLWLLENL
jgi:hypothetical protein